MPRAIKPQIMVNNKWVTVNILETIAAYNGKTLYKVLLTNGAFKLVPLGSFRNFYTKPCTENCETCKWPCDLKE